MAKWHLELLSVNLKKTLDKQYKTYYIKYIEDNKERFNHVNNYSIYYLLATMRMGNVLT